MLHQWQGESKQSSSVLSIAEDLAKAARNEYWLANINWMKGWIHYHNKQFESARSAFKDWIEYIKEYPPYYMPTPSRSYYRSELLFILGLLDLEEGLIDSAETKAAEMKLLLDDIQPYVYNWIKFLYDNLRGEVLLAQGSLEQAMSVCIKIMPSEIVITLSRWMIPYNGFIPTDVLARAYHQNGELHKAISEYERLITFDPSSVDRRFIHPKLHYRLAKLYEEIGSKGKAIKEYEKFLEIWKDADEDLPEPHDARARLTKLKDLRL